MSSRGREARVRDRDRRHIGSLGEDLLHPRIGLEGLALTDADGCQLTENFRILTIAGLALDDAVDFIKEVSVHRMDGVEWLARDVDEGHLRRIVLLAPAGRHAAFPSSL